MTPAERSPVAARFEQPYFEPVVLSPESVEAVARRVVALLDERDQGGLLSARQVAERLGISRWTVYDRSGEFGAIRLGDGPRARLRFDPKLVDVALTARSCRERSQPSVSPASSGVRRRRGPTPAARLPDSCPNDPMEGTA